MQFGLPYRKVKGGNFSEERISRNVTCGVLDNQLLLVSHTCILKICLLSRFGNKQAEVVQKLSMASGL